MSLDTGGLYSPKAEAQRKERDSRPQKRVIEQMKDLIAQNLATEIALGMQQPGLDPKLAMRSLTRFSTEVLPALRKE